MRHSDSAEANEGVALYLHSHNSAENSFTFTCLAGVFTLNCDQQVRARVYGTEWPTIIRRSSEINQLEMWPVIPIICIRKTSECWRN